MVYLFGQSLHLHQTLDEKMMVIKSTAKYLMLIFWMISFQYITTLVHSENKQVQFFSEVSGIFPNNNYYQYCIPFIKKKTFSTKRDLTLTSVFYKEKNVPLTLFSIRQSGCMATIVVLTNKGMKFSRQTIKIINCLSVKVVSSDVTGFKKRHTDFIRDEFACNFVKKFQKDIDRVFFFDAFDVFFERDPFEHFVGDHLFLFQESLLTIKEDPYDLKWMRDCYGQEETEKYWNNYFVCSGTIAGSASMFIRFFELLQSQKSWIDPNCGVDQGQLNYAIYSGLLTKNNISLVLFDHVGPVHTLNCAIKHFKYYWNNTRYVYVTNAKDEVASVLHQVKQQKKLHAGLYARCNFTVINNICQGDYKTIKLFEEMNLSN
ncbi:hypothetical protein TRFO_17771 [Tritrichomonas foetus]|uniref:Uncharacterized protein n=1 Tax=Tritrichomonas foetus TaxID=1144522 RepID=A0A1J4KM73_9EUKA|nr:hypothetical protein TRFO_17771 [Tritrichomonas foetus]|eukprot:OHT12401.1 hypothetical protein TRFO_17771 [Tritrichomonas foetus]